MHYIGSVQNAIYGLHENRKQNENVKHITTTKSQLNKQRGMLKVHSHKVYATLIQNKTVHQLHMSVLTARNKKQAANTILRKRKNKFLSSDDIIGLYLLHDKLRRFMEVMLVLPDFS